MEGVSDMKNFLSIYWAKGVPNFGDSVTPELMRYLLGREIVWTKKAKTELLSIGSILGLALLKDVKQSIWGKLESCFAVLKSRFLPKVKICGAGFIAEPFDHSFVLRRRALVYAVRGEKTLEILRKLGIVGPNQKVALGDPGLLFDSLWSDVKWTGRGSRKRGYVPHECYWGWPRFEAFRLNHPEIQFIDVRKPPKEVLKEIAAVDEVFSSSLHGLIAADSLGIPNRWVDLELEGKDYAYVRFKFDDYYSAYGAKREPIKLEEVPTADIGAQLDPTEICRVKESLKKAYETLRKELDK